MQCIGEFEASRQYDAMWCLLFMKSYGCDPCTMQIIRALQENGRADVIYTAIDTNDMVEIVKAAANALKTINFSCSRRVSKSKDTSVAALERGTCFYRAGQNNLAMNMYNRAIAFAPNKSFTMMLAYKNRSAVMFSIKYFTAYQEDVKTCLSMGCPKELAKKLSRQSYYSARDMLEEKYEATPFIRTFLRFDCERHSAVPCVSADVAFVNRDGAKLVTAGKIIKSGSVVAIERAFVSSALNDHLTCHHCKKLTPSLQPCEGCHNVMFCGRQCRDLCMEEYHRIECQIMGTVHDYIFFIKPANQMMLRSAIKLSLKLGWDALIAASKDMGASRMRTATVRQTYNSEEPLSILSYDDDKQFLEGKMFNGSIICAIILQYLDLVPDYFPTERSKREAAKEAMSKIMLHLYVTFTNTIPITCAAYDIKTSTYTPSVQTNYGWFSMCSKLKHSCEPNLLLVGLNDSVALVAIRTIKKGEELTISYIEYFYSFETPISTLPPDPPRREIRLFLETQHMCTNCKVCAEDWNAESDNLPMTEMNSQQAILQAKVGMHKDEFERYRTTCQRLDAFPLRTSGHKLSYVCMKIDLCMVQCYHTKNIIVS